nr:A24 family peptidase [Ammoniphilus resinae]
MCVVYFFVTWAAITDIKTRNISNRLTGSFLITGIGVNLIYGTWSGLFISFSISFIPALFLYKLGIYGGGDLKFFIALAVFSGLGWSFGVFFYSLIAALPLFLIYIIKERMWKPSVPYAVAIFVGIIWQHIDPMIKG